MAVHYYRPKTGFHALFSQMLTNLDQIWQDHGIHLWFQFDPEWCMGGSRTNDKEYYFVIRKCIITPVVYDVSLRISGKPINVREIDSAVVKRP